MEIIRRNTDYALRLLINLARRKQGMSVSARTLAHTELVPLHLTSKLLQRLNKAGLISSHMGSKGGFYLNKKPKDISLGEVVEIIQGALKVNKCILAEGVCQHMSRCTIRKEFLKLQNIIEDFYTNITLDRLAEIRHLNNVVKD